MLKTLTQSNYRYLKAYTCSVYSWTVLVFMMLFISASPVKSQTLPTDFNQVLVVNGLTSPTALTFSPDGRLFVAEQAGTLRVVKNGALLATPFVSLSVNTSGERGLLGIAFDPNFANNQYIYLYYTLASGANSRVSRFTANGDVAVAGSEVVVLELDPLVANNHNGGGIQFGIDGKLYVATGENGNSTWSQDLDSYHGKILRINPDGNVPPGNPFTTGSAQRQRVWAYGMRNPFTLAVQPGTGKIFANDVGQSLWEEVDDVTTGGLNFGWPNLEGTTGYAGWQNPAYNYTHGSGSGLGCAINGGTFFNPVASNYPSTYTGNYFFLDFCGNWIDRLSFNGSTVTRSTFASSIAGNPVGMATGPDGNIYFISRASSGVYKITYTGTSPVTVTTTLTPVADAYVRGGTSANTNFGTNAKVMTKKATGVNGNYQTYMKFDISSINPNVSSAKLRLYGSLSDTLNSSVSVNVYNSTDVSWNENAITWNNKPAALAALVATKTVTGIAKMYYELDIAPLLVSQKNAGQNLITLNIVNAANSKSIVKFNSKESAANKPQLVVVHTTPRLGQNDNQNNSIVNETQEMNFSVMPNPATDNISVTIENYAGNSELRIVDLTGKLAREVTINGTTAQRIFTGDLKAGMYFITVANTNGILTQKLIIEK